jgi:hypothetical protein
MKMFRLSGSGTNFNSACVLAPAHSGCLKMWLLAANILAWALIVLVISKVVF